MICGLGLLTYIYVSLSAAGGFDILDMMKSIGGHRSRRVISPSQWQHVAWSGRLPEYGSLQVDAMLAISIPEQLSDDYHWGNLYSTSGPFQIDLKLITT